MRRWYLLSAILALAGCGPDRAPPTGSDAGQTVADLRARFGIVERTSVDLRVLLRPAEGEHRVFTIRSQAEADGLLAVRLQEKDVTGYRILVRPDRTWTATDEQQKTFSRGTLDAVAEATEPGQRFFSLMVELGSEARLGPIPAAERYTFAEQGAVIVCAQAGGRSSRCRLDAGRTEAVERTLLDRQGRPICTLTYHKTQYLEQEKVVRARKTVLTFPDDPTVISFHLQTPEDFDVVPSFRAGTFELVIPADWPEESPTQFLRRLTGSGS